MPLTDITLKFTHWDTNIARLVCTLYKPSGKKCNNTTPEWCEVENLVGKTPEDDAPIYVTLKCKHGGHGRIEVLGLKPSGKIVYRAIRHKRP